MSQSMCWLVLYQLDLIHTHLGRGKFWLRKCPHQTGLWASLWCIFIIGNWCERAQPTVSGVTLAGDPGAIRKQAWASYGELGSHSSMSFCSSSCLQVPVLDSLSDGFIRYKFKSYKRSSLKIKQERNVGLSVAFDYLMLCFGCFVLGIEKRVSHMLKPALHLWATLSTLLIKC